MSHAISHLPPSPSRSPVSQVVWLWLCLMALAARSGLEHCCALREPFAFVLGPTWSTWSVPFSHARAGFNGTADGALLFRQISLPWAETVARSGSEHCSALREPFSPVLGPTWSRWSVTFSHARAGCNGAADGGLLFRQISLTWAKTIEAGGSCLAQLLSHIRADWCAAAGSGFLFCSKR